MGSYGCPPHLKHSFLFTDSVSPAALQPCAVTICPLLLAGSFQSDYPEQFNGSPNSITLLQPEKAPAAEGVLPARETCRKWRIPQFVPTLKVLSFSRRWCSFSPLRRQAFGEGSMESPLNVCYTDQATICLSRQSPQRLLWPGWVQADWVHRRTQPAPLLVPPSSAAPTRQGTGPLGARRQSGGRALPAVPRANH